MGLDVAYPQIIWPKTPPSPGAAPLIEPSESYKELQADGVPQNPVAGVPPQLIPADDDALEEPGVPPVETDPATGKPQLRQVPDGVKSVTSEKLKTDAATGWMKEQAKQFTNLPEIGTSFKKGILSGVATAIMGVNADIQMARIANTVGLGELDMQNFKALEPTLRIAMSNPDEKAREASKARIKAAIPSMLGLPANLRGTSEAFVDAAFDHPKFLDEMTERSKFKYNPFTDPFAVAAIEMQDNIDKRNPQDTAFVNSWADKIAGMGGSIASFLLARKAGGRVGLDAFAVYSGQGQAYQDALKAGASPEIAFKAASMGGFIGSTDVLPIERLVASPKVTKALFALAISAGKQAMIEGGQEGFQQFMQNVLAKTLYKPDQDVSQGVWENVVLGAIGGVGSDLATGGFREEMAKTPEQLTEEALSQSAPFKGPAADAVPPAAPLDVSDIQAKPGSYDPATWGKRPDGSDKGNGFLGVLQRPDGGVSTEISVGMEIGGKETDIPLLVPTLTRPEIDGILALDEGDPEFFKKLPPGVLDKARAFAEQRIAAGLPVFAGSTEKPVQPNSPGEPPIAPVTGEAAKPAPPTATTVAFQPPAPMKVGDISKLPPDQRAIEADYVMATDFNLVEPIRLAAADGTAVEDISAKIEPLLLPVKEYLARRGVTDAAEVKVELDGMVRNIIAKLAPEGSPQAPSRALAGSETSGAMAPSAPFDNWFKGSTVVGADGAPKTMYHGTRSDFSQFAKIDGGNAYGDGFYFIDDPAKASDYASGDNVNRISLPGNAGPNVMPVFLSMKKPFHTRKVLEKKDIDAIEAAANKVAPGFFKKGELAKNFDRAYAANGDNVLYQLPSGKQNEIIKAAGFDGMETGYGTVVFDKSQIKSAIGNDGTFDASDPDITSSVAPGAVEPSARGYETVTLQTSDEELDKMFPLAGDEVSGLKVRSGTIPNQSSISASIDNSENLKGVREVFIDGFEDNEAPTNPDKRTRDLAAEIKASGEIMPLIVAIDSKGAYILEGGHRFDALKLNGTKSFPALVVLDIDSLPNGEVTAAVAPGDQTDTGRFKAWFGDSKVVGPDGKPLVVHHGSIIKGLKKFSVDKAVEVEGAIFFTDNPDVAWQYTFERAYGDIISEEPLGDVVDAYLKIENPFEFTPKGKIVDAIAFGEAIAEAKAKGHDGVIVRNIDDSIGMTGDMGDVYVVFAPTQIKSAVSNDGSFDAADPDITSSVAPAAQTETPEFQNWFKESKVVDEDGEPLVVYHGTAKDITSLKAPDSRFAGKGIYFTKNPNYAALYSTSTAAINGDNGGEVIYPVYLSMQRPLVIEGGNYLKDGRKPGEPAQKSTAHLTANDIAAYKEQGYDGIISPGNSEYIVFDPTQIKSAIGNSGAFDPSNPDITAALPLKPKGVRHAYIHERIRPRAGIQHQVMVNGQSVVDIAKKFKDALGLVVQVGRFGSGVKGAEAIFKWGQSVVRVKNETDLTTLFHEGGHHLHQMMGNPLNAVITKHRAELEHIATHYYGGGGVIDIKNKSLIEKEGFAHFFQVYVNNPLEARNIAPGFAPDFEALLDKEQPGVRKALTEIIKAVDVQITQKSSMQIALEHVSPGTKPGNIRRIVEAAKGGNLMHEIGTLINRAYMGAVGSEFALQHTVHELARIAESNYRVLLERGEMSAAQVKIAIDRLSKVGKSDPVKMYWAAKNSAMRSAEFLHSGVQKFNTTDYKAVSKGFAEIMANVVGDARGHLHEETVHAFDAYLMARRIRSERQNHKATVAWMRRGGKASGLPPPPIIRANDPDSSFSEGDTNQSIADFEKAYPRFKQAADDVYGFLRAMIEYRRDAGDFTKEEADYMLAFEDYVPVHRVIEDLKRLSGAGQGVDGKSNGIKQFKGSGRQIVSPLRSIWQMTHQQLDVSMKNEMKLSLVNMALDIGQGTGALIEKIPDTQMTGTTVNLSELLKAAGHIDLTAAGVQVQGTDIQDLNELADEIMSGDETATIWRPGDINEKGEHIIYVRRHGKREAYKLNDPAWADDLYRTLTDLAPPQRTMLIHILSAPARALRWGVVTEPIYQLANIIRDGFTTFVLQPGTLPFQVVGKGIKNHLYRSEMSKLYNLSGTTIAGRGIEKLDKRKFGIEQGFLAKQGINLQDVPGANGVAEVVRTFYSSEALGRQGLFARSYERAIKDGLAPHDALVEAGYTTTDYANYGRGGSRMAELRAIIPFLGAGIQGLDKFGRAAFGGTALPALMRKQLMPYMNRMLNLEGSKTSLPLSKIEAESFKYSMKVQAAMFTLGIASMLLDSAYWGDEEYEQFSPYLRGTRWLIKLGPGQWLGIPKPFQYSFYSTLFSYGLDSVFKGDTTAMMKFLESQLYVTALPYENPGIGLAYELAFNKDLFTGRDIVPQNLAARPWRMQSDVYTSVLGKQLGAITGLSPMVIDHVITSSFATWGRSAMSLSNLTDSTKPEQGLEDYAFTRYFVKNGSRSTTVKPAFWNLVGQSTGNLVGAYSAFRDLMDGGAAGQAQQYLSGATDDEKVYTLLNYYQKADAKKLHPLRNANDMVTTLSAMRKEIMASNFKLDGGEGERLVLTPTIQRQLIDRLSSLGVREMRNALVLTDQPGFGGKRIMPTLSIYKEIEAIDGRVARELKNRLGSKVYSFDKLRQMWPQVRTEILLNGEHAKLTPFVSQARAGGKNYFTEGDAQP